MGSLYREQRREGSFDLYLFDGLNKGLIKVSLKNRRQSIVKGYRIKNGTKLLFGQKVKIHQNTCILMSIYLFCNGRMIILLIW